MTVFKTIILIITSSVLYGQSMDQILNTEKDISGECFITLSDTFNYYEQPIILLTQNEDEFIKIEFNDSLGITTTYNNILYKQFDSSNPFNPWLWVENPDYFRLAFQCVDTIGSFYKVEINEKENAFIRKSNSAFEKVSIEEFIKNWTTLGLDFNRENNPLRSQPETTSKIIDNPSSTIIWRATSVDIDGDWLKIKTAENEVGWIKWREGKKVLIKMYYAC